MKELNYLLTKWGEFEEKQRKEWNDEITLILESREPQRLPELEPRLTIPHFLTWLSNQKKEE